MRSLLLILLPALASASVSFNREIRPILSKNCLGCHGPDEGDRKGDFHLDTFEGITKGGKSGPGIIPGDPDASEVIKRITSSDPDDLMPPSDHGKPLHAEEIDLLRLWIKEGAHYEPHWSLQKPEPITPPASSHPSPKNPIDHFIASSLEPLGLIPAPEADPRILLRRLALDLTGLPPSLEEVEAFAADPSEANYQAAIQRYLADPAYGENWAAMWLDIARYADTVGYAGDEHRNIWPWRDWVIEAFNNNMPYDQFTIEQLAGDLLPNPTPSQILATAFHRNTLNNNEGGTNDEEFRTIAVKDRISTTMNAWMGLTLRCAECHTHKYDPITQEEYYRFYAFFNQTEDNDRGNDAPHLAFDPLEGDERAQLEEEVARIQSEMENHSPWSPLIPSELTDTFGTTLTALPDHSITATGTNPPQSEYLIKTTTGDQPTHGLRLELLPSDHCHQQVGRHPNGSVVVSHIGVKIGDEDQVITAAAADFVQPSHDIQLVIGKNEKNRGWAVQHPETGYRGEHFAVFSLEKPIPPHTEIIVSVSQNSPWPETNAGRIRLAAVSIPDPVAKFKNNSLHPLQSKLAGLKKQLEGSRINVPILRELTGDKQRVTKIMARGSFLQPTDEVTAGVPEALDFWPENAPKNRLGVARWLMSPENPLTARVAVNRLWARLFGMGIVETEEDFGIQGILPSHPELLDWLALEYQKDWDTKKLLALLVSSHTYRQSAIADSLRLEKDPRNKFLSRGPRFRLPAEVVRDNALAVSGLLSKKQHGPPVYPPNPIKRYVNAFTGGMTWTESQGEDRHRRALYTYLKRSSPHPLFETFDMATRDVCNMRRIRTNTPLQSFMTLNDIAFIEAAQALAQKMTAHSENPEEQIAHGLRLALLSSGTPEQIAILADLYQDNLATYQNDPEAAQKLSGSPENSAHLASLTVVANVIMNLDAFLTK